MIATTRILAVVPARSGSKGIPDKNMQALGGNSLIARAGLTLKACPSVDRAIISTDSPRYAAEGRTHGLDAPFLRPPELSTDTAGAVETVIHAMNAAETHYGEFFGIVLIVEPTCPLRRPDDIEGALGRGKRDVRQDLFERVGDGARRDRRLVVFLQHLEHVAVCGRRPGQFVLFLFVDVAHPMAFRSAMILF